MKSQERWATTGNSHPLHFTVGNCGLQGYSATNQQCQAYKILVFMQGLFRIDTFFEASNRITAQVQNRKG